MRRRIGRTIIGLVVGFYAGALLFSLVGLGPVGVLVGTFLGGFNGYTGRMPFRRKTAPAPVPEAS